MIVKLNEAALLASGFDRSFVAFLRHTIRQLGDIIDQTTLPEVAEIADTLAPIVAGLTITVTATSAAVGEILTDREEHTRSDAHLVRRLDEMQAELGRANGERIALARQIAELQDQFGVVDRPAMAETGDTIRTKLGITTLSGSNTGDQTTITGNAGSATVLQTARTINGVSFNGSANITVADATRALLAGSSSQAFATSTLAASDVITVTKTSNGATVEVMSLKNAGTGGNTKAELSYSAAGTKYVSLVGGYGGAAPEWTVDISAVTQLKVATAGVTVTTGFGCNSKTPQTAYALGAAATDLATVLVLANNLRTMSINNGTGS